MKTDDIDKKLLYVEIGTRLKSIRTQNQYTQDGLAELLGVSAAYYGKVERGQYALSIEKMALLHRKLDIDLGFLITGKLRSKISLDDEFINLPERCLADMKLIIGSVIRLVEQGKTLK